MLFRTLTKLLQPTPTLIPASRPHERVTMPMMPDEELIHDEWNWPRDVPGTAPIAALIMGAADPATTAERVVTAFAIQQCGAREPSYGHHDHVVMTNHGMGQQIMRCCHCARERVVLIPTAAAMQCWVNETPCGPHSPMRLGALV